VESFLAKPEAERQNKRTNKSGINLQRPARKEDKETEKKTTAH